MAPLIAPEAAERYGHHMREARTTEGGHLALGRGGFTLYFARGACPSGRGCEAIKTACIAAAVPVIESRGLGRSRGGFTSRLRIRGSAHGLPLALHVTAGREAICSK
jgi:hypothetical protein